MLFRCSRPILISRSRPVSRAIIIIDEQESGRSPRKAPRACLIRVGGQKKSFKASCPMRGSLACPALKLPKAPALIFWKFVSEAESSMKLARLNTLKNSARNWSFKRSVNEKFLESPMSQVYEPGKRKVPLPMLPNVPELFDSNEAGLSQSTRDLLIFAAAHA